MTIIFNILSKLLLIAGKVLLKYIIFLARIAIYPVVSFIKIYHILTNSKINSAIKCLKLCYEAVSLGIWFVLVIILLNRTNINLISMFANTTVALQHERAFESFKTPDTMKPSSNVSSSVNSNISSDGKNYNIDIDNIPNSVALPAGTYQTGTPRQRAELLLILQEICERPEITCTVEQILGVMYAECTGYIGASGSLVETCWPQEHNAYDCGGPFQHMISDWNGNEYKQGKIFICKLEDPNLDDSERVKTSGNYITKDGVKRPSKFFFPDAAYVMAVRLSKTYPDSAGASSTNWTAEVGAWAKSQGFSDYIEDILRMNSAYAFHNGYISGHKSWIPSWYSDIMLKYGKINQWSSLATSRSNLNNKIKNELLDITRTIPNFKPNYTYYDTYREANNNTQWQAVQFAFVTHNGGKWMYDSLHLLAEEIGELISPDITQPTGTDFDAIYTEAKKHLGKPYVLSETATLKRDPPNNFCCASFVSWVMRECGYKFTFTESAQSLYNQCASITKSELQPGDIIFFERTYNGPNPITHVGIYIGNNRIIHAGSPVEETELTSWYTSRIAGYGRLSKK